MALIVALFFGLVLYELAESTGTVSATGALARRAWGRVAKWLDYGTWRSE